MARSIWHVLNTSTTGMYIMDDGPSFASDAVKYIHLCGCLTSACTGSCITLGEL